ncbi:MAG: RNA polymerase sigma factor RpoH [Zoogloeaceae bacterium]|nr:RNA polymerase sigma factor RpoH [Zoogloeaceae bacterium]
MNHALALPVPSAAGSIDAYIQAAQRAPLLSEEEEFRLARQFHETGDLDAARRLVLSHLRLVISVARGYLGYGLPHADLIQEGNVGLMKAVKRFDPARGIRLVSFALHWIKAEIHEYILKNWRLVKVATTKAQRKLFFNLRSLKNSLTHTASLSSAQTALIAEKLGVKPEEVREMEGRMGVRDLALEGQADDGEESFAPIDYLTDSHYEPTCVIESRDYARLQDEGLHNALKNLDARSRRIIEARWLPANDGETATLHELAAEFQVSAERIRQIEVKALQKMRQSIGEK